jgi:hypothetical protein
MKETSLHKAFEEARQKLDADRMQENVARQLGILKRVAVEFQDAGVPLTLTCRPGIGGSEVKGNESIENEVFANGEIEAPFMRLDFVLEDDGYYHETMHLKIFKDGEVALERTSTYDEDKEEWADDDPEEDDTSDDEDSEPKPRDLKSALTRLIVETKAKDDFVSRFNVGPKGLPQTEVEKPITLPPPIKLKKPRTP